MYLNSRFYFTGLLFKCQFCIKSRRRGKIEDFKEKMIQDVKKNPDMRDAFYRYCLGDKEMKYLQAEMIERKQTDQENQKLNDRAEQYKGKRMASDFSSPLLRP